MSEDEGEDKNSQQIGVGGGVKMWQVCYVYSGIGLLLENRRMGE